MSLANNANNLRIFLLLNMRLFNGKMAFFASQIMFTAQEDKKIKEASDFLNQILLEIPSLVDPTHTPFKKHILPDYIRFQLFKLLVKEHPDWKCPQKDTEK
jgi:hypothetical protein